MTNWTPAQLAWRGHLRGHDDLASLLADVDAEAEKAQHLLDKLKSGQHLITRKTPATVIRKTVTAEVDQQTLEYILSTESIDRYGDSISAAGWQLDNFRRNPVCLFNHNSDIVIGVWKNTAVVNGKLRGRLDLVPQGASPRIDEIRALVAHGAIRSTSVGFRPIESEPLPSGGLRYTKQELVEASLVSCPANPDCLQIAKSLNVSAETQAMVFKDSGAARREEIMRKASPLDRRLYHMVDMIGTKVGKVLRQERDHTDSEIDKLRVEIIKLRSELKGRSS